jgi:hypothetical protein
MQPLFDEIAPSLDWRGLKADLALENVALQNSVSLYLARKFEKPARFDIFACEPLAAQPIRCPFARTGDFCHAIHPPRHA